MFLLFLGGFFNFSWYFVCVVCVFWYYFEVGSGCIVKKVIKMDASGSGDLTEGMVGDMEEPHVLAVDDNLVDRKIVEKLLKNSSCKVTTAENGLRALEYLGLGDNKQSGSVNNNQVSKVNMIITDYCMPGMTGYELLKKIKESSVMKDVPVVIMSSENVPTRISKCLEEGAQMFMLKPLKHSDVKKLRCQLLQSSVGTSSKILV